MNRLPLYGTVIVLANCGVIVWHLLILARLHSMLSDGQILLIAILVNLIPFTALLLLWTRFRKIAGWLLLASLGIGLLIGTYEHFLSSSPDNVFRMAPRRVDFAVSNYCRVPDDRRRAGMLDRS